MLTAGGLHDDRGDARRLCDLVLDGDGGVALLGTPPRIAVHCPECVPRQPGQTRRSPDDDKVQRFKLAHSRSSRVRSWRRRAARHTPHSDAALRFALGNALRSAAVQLASVCLDDSKKDRTYATMGCRLCFRGICRTCRRICERNAHRATARAGRWKSDADRAGMWARRISWTIWGLPLRGGAARRLRRAASRPLLWPAPVWRASLLWPPACLRGAGSVPPLLGSAGARLRVAPL